MLALVLASALLAPAAPIHVRESAADLRPVQDRRAAIRPAVADEPARVYVVVPALTPERRAALEAAGLAIELPAAGAVAPRWRSGVAVQGTASAAARAALARLPFVRAVETAGRAWTNVGSVETAGDTVLGSAAARTLLGVDGTGVTIGVISDGVDSLAASAASGDVPPDVGLPAIPGLPPPGGDEGTAELEIVHDVAPGAHLVFAPAHTSVEMVAAIDGLAGAGAQVILDDLVFTDEPKFEDGPIAQAARRFATGGGIYVAAAGNYATSHYYAPYARGASGTFAGFTYPALHDFGRGDLGDSFRVPAGADLIAVLQWNDPFGATADDFDLILARRAGGATTVLAASIDQQATTRNPFEGVRWTNTTGAAQDVFLSVGEFQLSGDPSRLRLNLVVFSTATVVLEHLTPREAVFGHGAVEEVLSVAAADAVAPTRVESFSSNGPATIFFPTRGVRQVPRITGTDGIETAVGRSGRFVDPFFGTSAAAPHVAGCAALLLAAGAPAAIIPSVITNTAMDLSPAGFDFASGAGLLDCLSAARVATGRAKAPVVDAAAAFFDTGAAITITAGGHDDDADARTATIRLLDDAGDEVARDAIPVVATGTAFTVADRLRDASLARVRAVAVRVRDATGLDGAETTAPLACPHDGSLGDALCTVGDLIAMLDPTPGHRARRMEARARSAAAALVRAGRADDAARPGRRRHNTIAAAAKLRTVARLALRLPGDPGPAVAATAQALSQLLRAK